MYRKLNVFVFGIPYLHVYTHTYKLIAEKNTNFSVKLRCLFEWCFATVVSLQTSQFSGTSAARFAQISAEHTNYGYIARLATIAIQKYVTCEFKAHTKVDGNQEQRYHTNDFCTYFERMYMLLNCYLNMRGQVCIWCKLVI